MPVSKKNKPKINYDQQLTRVMWRVKDGKIEKDEYVQVNHNGKIRNKHSHRVFTPRSMKGVKKTDNKCKTLFPGRHTRRNMPKTKMLADVPELLRQVRSEARTKDLNDYPEKIYLRRIINGLSNVRNAKTPKIKMVRFSPDIQFTM